ncbi:hypothetical protein ANCDUO_15398, partial [Ancylostoma duodenale]
VSPSLFLSANIQAFIDTAKEIYRKIQEGVFDINNEVIIIFSVVYARLTESNWVLSTHRVLQILPEEMLQVDWVDPVDAVEQHVNKEIYQDDVFLFFLIEDLDPARESAYVKPARFNLFHSMLVYQLHFHKCSILSVLCFLC